MSVEKTQRKGLRLQCCDWSRTAEAEDLKKALAATAVAQEAALLCFRGEPSKTRARSGSGLPACCLLARATACYCV